MNQILKDAVYCNGNRKHVDFIAEIGGMTPEEKRVFEYIHDGEQDVYIQMQMGLSRKTYDRISEQVRRKTLTAIMNCIEFKMNNM